jgi:hypothetical protein
MSKEALEVYSGHELPLKFVARRVDGKETPLWRYCRDRFEQRWAHEKPRRDVPDAHEGGRSGWWFPQTWVSDYHAARHPVAVATRERSVEPPKFTQRIVWPGLQEFHRWKLPVATKIVAADATVIYPNGTIEGWASVQQRVGKQAAERPPEMRQPEVPAEEPAASPSPELVETLLRKEWLAARQTTASEPADPQAWRFETADTQV